jgi:hypothetical protein
LGDELPGAAAIALSLAASLHLLHIGVERRRTASNGGDDLIVRIGLAVDD